MHTKTSMSYVDLAAWLTEWRDKLTGSVIENVYRAWGSEAFLFKLHGRDGDNVLLLEPGKRVHLTRVERRKEADGSVIRLRELVRSAHIRSIGTVNEERVMRAELSNGNWLIVELLPRGVLTVTDGEGKILYVSERRKFKDRVLEPGAYYAPPPPSPFRVPRDISEALGEVSENKWREIVEKVSGGLIAPCLKKGFTVLPVEFPGCERRENFNDALEEFFNELEQKTATEKARERIEAERAKIGASLKQVEEAERSYFEEAEKLVSLANRILVEYARLEELLSRARREGKTKLEVELGGTKVELDSTVSVQRNASYYFDKAKELRNKAKKAAETAEELRRRLAELGESAEDAAEMVKLSVRTKQWYERYRWTLTRRGFLVIAGKDADQNESVVKRYLGEKDIYLHADLTGAPSTVLLTQGRQPTEEDIYDAAVLAACYSRAWKVGLAAADVFWVFGSQVSKTPPSGEYISKGSFMVYGKKNYIKGVKLELTLGLEGKERKPIVGSEEAVSSRTDVYVVLRPGDELEKLADRVVRIFSKRGEIKGIGALKDELLKLLPGKSSITRVSKTLLGTGRVS
ncbi:RNA-binding protein [Sulfodiicoccus acidiphilus]|uniref:RNA-binding protein n=1 Tax=Sulfodiicoccus acidiphilus TaxID=1670455 RepID=A0A348B2T4_9CREN|nr:NFACT family protein [Sulfodiicoccus acidiphilus]BBD72486.1 RNA-binding protein [Sulfodiicoccus acidiphilus]GGT96779.1 RNA-binding protein [Sulfodiicoccus acidiphilus]